jgi:hypothetical protein
MGSDRGVDSRLTAAEVRDLLVGAGWGVFVENEECIILSTKDKKWCIGVWLRVVDHPFELGGHEQIYRSPLPSTAADLWALLRCVGAPVPDTKGLPDVVAMSDSQPRKGCVHYSYIGPERRHADIAIRIPPRIGVILESHLEYVVWRYGAVTVTMVWDEYRRLMGRRAADWRREEGGTHG